MYFFRLALCLLPLLCVLCVRALCGPWRARVSARSYLGALVSGAFVSRRIEPLALLYYFVATSCRAGRRFGLNKQCKTVRP